MCAWLIEGAHIRFDLPQDPDMFVHRIGRTARMGRDGNALALLMPQEEAYLCKHALSFVHICHPAKCTRTGSTKVILLHVQRLLMYVNV